MANEKKEQLIKDFFEYVNNNDIDSVKQCIQNGVDVNATNVNGSTSLILASQYGHLEIVKYLVEIGANVNAKNNEGISSIMYSARNGYFKIVKHLVEHDADVNVRNVRNETAVLYSSKHKHLEVLQYLIEHRADVNIPTDIQHITALMYASELGHHDIVECLVKNGAKVNEKNSTNKTSLMYASERGHHDIVEYLVKNGADISIEDTLGYSAMTFATNANNSDVIKYLKIFEYVKEGNSEVVERFINQDNFDINEKDSNNHDATALLIASKNGHSKLVKFLIEHGASVDIVDKYGYTALMRACYEGHFEIVKIIYEYIEKNKTPKEVNDYVNSKNHDGETAFMRIALGDKFDINRKNMIIYFVDIVKVDINIRDKKGRNALQKAERKSRKSTEMIKFLKFSIYNKGMIE